MSLCIPKIHYRFSKFAFNVSPKVIIISIEGLQEASLHLCVQGIVGYTQKGTEEEMYVSIG